MNAPRRTAAALALTLTLLLAAGCAAPRRTVPPPATRTAPPAAEAGFVPLFPAPGVPTNWLVRGWSDIAQPAPPEALWTVREGVLHGSVPRGTWLVSEAEYGDFVLELEIRMGARGHGGVAVRVPPHGDPTYEALEIQLADPRFYGTNRVVAPADQPGAIAKALPPAAPAWRAEEWNTCRIECRGSGIRVTLNGQRVIDADLSRHTGTLPRGEPLAFRPRRGHLAFQELSRDGAQVLIRNARIRVLD